MFFNDWYEYEEFNEDANYEELIPKIDKDISNLNEQITALGDSL